MRKLITTLRNNNETGAAFAEYGLLLTGIAVVAAGSVALFGGRVATLYTVIF